MNDILELEIRQKIHNLISKNPGIKLSRIAKLLKLSVPLADYHLRYMYNHGLITYEKISGAHKRYYLTGSTSLQDKKYLRLLRQDIPLQIVLYLLKNPQAQHKDILENFELAPSTLSYYLKKLIKQGIITTTPHKRGYQVIDEQQVIQFLIRHKQSQVLQRFKGTWADDFGLP